MKNKSKGFTLIELLIVVVILALVATAAAMAIIPMYNQARADSFKTDALGFIDGAKNAYVLNKHESDNSTTTKKCYDIKELVDQGIIEKSLGDPITKGGYIVIDTTATPNTYTVWYTDGEFYLNGTDENKINDEDYETLGDANDALGNTIPACSSWTP